MKKLIHQLTKAIILLLAGYSGLHAQTPGSVPFFTVLSPIEVSGGYSINDGYYTTSITSGWGGDLSNSVILAPLKIADAGQDSLLCDSLGTTDFTGKIALIGRGVCEFGRKALNAQQHGALAVIIINHTLTNPSGIATGMGAGLVGSQVTIPVLMISNSQGLQILQVINSGQEVMVSMGSSPAGFTLLEGNIKVDQNNNCTPDAGEPVAPRIKIGIETGVGSFHVRETQPDGSYKIYVDPAQGPFTITPLGVNQGWVSCPLNATAVTSSADTIQNNFTVDGVNDCVQLEAEISSPFLRRCFDANFTVEVCNNGTVNAVNPYVIVTLAHEFGPIHNATLPYTLVSADVYRFNLANLDPFACTTIHFDAEVACNNSTMLGQTLCYDVHAFPDTSCIQPSQSWSGANVTVSGYCNGNEVKFTITNSSTIAMPEMSEYIVIQDDVMYMTAPFQLGAGESETVSVPADGSTWRLEAAQVPYHPITTNPSKSVEGCTVSGNYTTGYFLMFPLDEGGPAEDEECQEIIGSYDPNDKQGLPTGFTEAHLIRPEVDIDYRIRFQNTGTDTAFTVIVRDTLSKALDPLSIRSVFCSHPYKMEINSDSILTFRFDHILLVDSFTNEQGSHGYLSFKISQQPNNPFGTSIDNRAGIYFDFNPPVMTNTTHHEVGEVITVVPVKDIPGQTPPLVYPNPVSANAILQLQGDRFVNATYTFYDLQGRIIHSGQVNNNRIPVTGATSGMYILKLVTEKGERYAVKVAVK